MRYVLALIVLSLTSCSSVEKINNNALDIADVATISKQRFVTIMNEARVTGFVDKDLIFSEAQAGAEEQNTIISHTNNIVKAIPHVEDSVPYWAKLMQWGLIALAVIGSFVLLWYLGLGYPIKAIMRSFSSMIPSKKKESAKLLFNAQDPDSATTVREAVAVLRATDKDFDAAYKKAIKESKLK